MKRPFDTHQLFSYKGYSAQITHVEMEGDKTTYFGKVINCHDSITFYGEGLKDFIAKFKQGVDAYKRHMKEMGYKERKI